MTMVGILQTQMSAPGFEILLAHKMPLWLRPLPRWCW